MSRPPPSQPAPRTQPTLGTAPRQPANTSGAAGAAPRRSAGGLPGLARTASALRQASPQQAPPFILSNLPAHLRPSTAPRIPSPLGKGTPGKPAVPKQSLPVRTSKTTQRHVFLPEEPQTAPLPFPASASAPPVQSKEPPGTGPYHDRTEAEKMTKKEREEAGLPRLTAYATAEGYRMKLLQAFLKREHGCGVVRVFDDAVYAVYNLPLLPGYGASSKVRSSPAVKSPGGISLLDKMNQAEELGYHDGFFPILPSTEDAPGGVGGPTEGNPGEWVLSSSPPAVVEGLEGLPEMRADVEDMGRVLSNEEEGRREERGIETILEEVGKEELISPETTPPSFGDRETFDPPPEVDLTDPPLALSFSTPQTVTSRAPPSSAPVAPPHRRRRSSSHPTHVADVVFFSYGVTVFFGLSEREEREILEDCETAGGWVGGLDEEDWEVESCHYEYVGEAEYPRIYNDMFTFKTHSHLLKLSVSHAIAQSTKLSIYESVMQSSLALTEEFPKELAMTGELRLGRREALKITGRLWRLRMDVNLSSGILDTPELFWSEASLLPLYEAIRDYLETPPRVQVLNDRLAVSGELLEIIHDYIDQGAMHRITWIIIILIVVAVVVAAGEVTARIIYFSTKHRQGEMIWAPWVLNVLPRVPKLSLFK